MTVGKKCDEVNRHRIDIVSQQDAAVNCGAGENGSVGKAEDSEPTIWWLPSQSRYLG